MNNWKYLFEDKILDRGYFYTDNVEITERIGEKVTAVVSGTWDYDVEITFKNGLVDDMYCSCPYFETDNCKHLAALLYVLEEECFEPVSEDITDLFNSVSTDDLKEFLFDELNENSQLLNKFKLKFSNSADRHYYKSKLDKICYTNQNRYMINDFLCKDIDFLIEKEEYKLVLDLIDDVFPFITDWWNYWEDYGSDDNIEEVHDIISKLIDTPVHDDVFEWLGDIISEIDDDHMNDLCDLYFSEFKNSDELQDKLALLDSLINTSSDIKWIRFKIDVMEDLNYPIDEINDFRKDYLDHEIIMRQYIDSTEDIDKEMLLKKAIHKFRNAERYEVQLKDYYYSKGDKKNYLKLLEDLILKYSNINYFNEFKKHFEGDWLLKREEILNLCSSDDDFLNEIYASEKLYDRLIDNIYDLWDLEMYGELLVRDYSFELIQKYSKIAYDMALKSGPPKHYYKIAEIIKTIYNLPNGKDKAIMIVEDFKTRYKRRPRMLQALKELKMCE